MSGESGTPRAGSGAAPAAGPVSLFLPTLGGGGAERVALTVADGLARSGVAVDLLIAGSGGANRDLVPDGVGLVELGAGRVLSSVPALARYLRRRRPLSLLAAMSHAGLAALLARALARVPTRVIIAEHAAFSPMSRYAAPKLRWMAGLRRWFYPRADAVMAVSEGVADDLARTTGFPREEIRVIYNPAVTPRLHKMAREPVEHPWLSPPEGGSDGPPLVLAVGRFKNHKNFPMLVRAFADVRRERPARLLLLGEGPERAAVEAAIAEEGVGEVVSAPGFVVNPYPYMARADLFVLSSSAEGLPGALLEAMALGCPVVSTDCESGPREILDGGRLAPLVPVEDRAALAAAIAGALDDPPDGEALARRAAEFSPEAILPRYRELLGV